VEASWDWDWDKAETYFRKAIELEPNNATSHQWYAEFLWTLGRFDEAIEQIELAEELDPLALIIRSVKAWAYYFAGNMDRAIVESERAIELDPTFNGSYLILGNAKRYTGLYDEATEAYAHFYDTYMPGAGEGLRNAFARGGMEAVVRAVIDGLRQAGQADYVSPASIALQFASIGEADSAMVWLEKAYDARAYPVEFVAVAPAFEPIHDDPRFIDLLGRMNLDDVTPAYAR
jgi:tetratricopeptide (TPR) repeat protein